MRTSKTFSIQFWMDVERAKNGQCHIYARVNVDQKRLSISLKRKIVINSWDAKNKRVIGRSQKASDFNRY